jgi:hypothetical protein
MWVIWLDPETAYSIIEEFEKAVSRSIVWTIPWLSSHIAFSAADDSP